MNRIQRQAITAAGLLAVVFAPKTAMAQNRGQRSPVIAVVTFASHAEPAMGIEIAEAIRQRLGKFFPQPARPGQIRVVTQKEINTFLTSSGYPADSAITTTDLRDLGKTMGADETLEGDAKRTAQGVEVHARFYSLNNTGIAEVLPTVVEKDAGAAGRKVAELFVQARKGIADYQTCKNALIANQPDQAITAAKASLTQYQGGVMARACMLTAYNNLVTQKKFPVDSVLRVANEIISLDPSNEVALGSLVDAYRTKGDTAKAIEFGMKLYQLNPSNTQTAQSIVNFLFQSGAPDKALTIIDDMMKNNPGDPAIIETQWKALLATSQWKRAIAAGEEMIKFDSSKADTAYYRRQIGAAASDSQPQLVLQLLGRATAKFPKDTRLLLAYSQELRKQGQVQQALDVAKKALAVDPKIDQGYANVIQLYVTLGQPDSAMTFGKQAIAANSDSTTKQQVGNALLTLISPAMNKAQSDTAAPPAAQRANWENVYRMSAVVDSIIPQASTAFFMSFAAYNISSNTLAMIPEEAKTDKPKACTDLKYASDMILVTELNMPRGGRYNQQAAGQILNALGSSIKPYVEGVKKQLACK